MKILDRDRLQNTLQNRLDAHIRMSRVSGAHLLVTQGGETVCEVTGGWQDPMTKEPIRSDAVYRLASMTKPVTAVAALIAVDMGLFGLDDLVSDYLPGYEHMMVAGLVDGQVKVEKPSGVPLRIWHMLSHCSGVMAGTELGAKLRGNTPPEALQSLETIVNYCADQPLAFEPTTYTAYCAYAAFDVVARIIELRSGMSYHDFLKKYIFEPLGMKDTTYTPSDAQWERMIAMTDKLDFYGLAVTDMGKHTFEGFPLTYTCAGAGLVSTMEDYAKFSVMLLQKGRYGDKQLFAPELLEEMTKVRLPADTPCLDPISWGLGVRVVTGEDFIPVGCFGWSGAYGCHFWVDPVNEITAVYMRNSRWYDSGGCGRIGAEFEADVMSCLKK